MENTMVLDETMNLPDDSFSNLNPQLALLPIWNDTSCDRNEGFQVFLFDDDIDEEDMGDDESFDDMDDDFDDDFDDEDDDFDDEDDDYDDDEDDDYDYEEDVDYDDFDD